MNRSRASAIKEALRWLIAAPVAFALAGVITYAFMKAVDAVEDGLPSEMRRRSHQICAKPLQSEPKTASAVAN